MELTFKLEIPDGAIPMNCLNVRELCVEVKKAVSQALSLSEIEHKNTKITLKIER